MACLREILEQRRRLHDSSQAYDHTQVIRYRSPIHIRSIGAAPT
jgi:hypothetical protein